MTDIILVFILVVLIEIRMREFPAVQRFYYRVALFLKKSQIWRR